MWKEDCVINGQWESIWVCVWSNISSTKWAAGVENT